MFYIYTHMSTYVVEIKSYYYFQELHAQLIYTNY